MKKYILKSTLIFALTFTLIGRCFANEYVCFSLNEAKIKLNQLTTDKDYRILFPKIFKLGNMTEVKGLVYDSISNDIIIVGKKDAQRQPITLDDFVVALTARFVFKKWPLVSIDPNEKTKASDMLSTRFDGGIENTQFGKDLLDADYILKKLAFGILRPDIPELKSVSDLAVKKQLSSFDINNTVGSRYWFFPILPQVLVRKDVVSIRELRIGVFTEVISAIVDGVEIEDLSTINYAPGNEFAKSVSESFFELAKIYPSINRLQSLNELVALTKAIEEMKVIPDFHFWLNDYKIKKTNTLEKVSLVKTERIVKAPSTKVKWKLLFEGGVELKAIALKLSAGDVSALKQAALKTKPKESIFWSFILSDGWIITDTQNLDDPDVVSQLFTHASFLINSKRYDDAIKIYEKVEELSNDYRPYATFQKAILLRLEGAVKFSEDLIIKSNELFNQIIESNPDYYSDCKYQLGLTSQSMGDSRGAIKFYNEALTNDPNYFNCFLGLGLTYYKTEQDALAEQNFKKYLEYDSESENALLAKKTLNKIRK